jgi:molybdopterin synthase catalytic subunit
MEIRIEIIAGPLRLPESLSPTAGGVVRFTGVVRDAEQGDPIDALEYEAYEPMASQQMRKILADLCGLHPFQSATVLHRIGWVPAGEAAILLEIQSAHRAEAFAVAASFMDRLKQDVPIWKSGVKRKPEAAP